MAKSEPSYTPLDWEGLPEQNSKLSRTWKFLISSWKGAVLVILTTLLLALSVVVVKQDRQLQRVPFQYRALDLYAEKHIQTYQWWTDYSTRHHQSEELSDKMWDAIVPAHGIVAVDHEWAAAKNLPDSMSMPSDPSKGVYIIDAYHQLHCLKIVRKTFFEIARGEPLTYPLGHSTHCFDSFRQYVQCTAGDTLLYSWGKNTTGDGQQRQCRDWQALSDWATEHTACYRDGEKPIPLLEHFGHCDDGTDGLTIN